MDPLSEGIAELLRCEITVAQLCVDAANRQKALQYLLLDPIITDMDVAIQVLGDYLESHRDNLSQFPIN